MLFLNSDFWPLFWAVVGGGAGLTGLLSLFVTSAGPGRVQARVPAQPVPAQPVPAQPVPAPRVPAQSVPAEVGPHADRDREPAHSARAA